MSAFTIVHQERISGKLTCFDRLVFKGHPAPRGALTYPPRSGEGLEVTSLGSMADLDSKDEGDNSMPSEPSLVPRRTGRGDGGPA
jgi:hypothetical protein